METLSSLTAELREFLQRNSASDGDAVATGPLPQPEEQVLPRRLAHGADKLCPLEPVTWQDYLRTQSLNSLMELLTKAAGAHPPFHGALAKAIDDLRNYIDSVLYCVDLSREGAEAPKETCIRMMRQLMTASLAAKNLTQGTARVRALETLHPDLVHEALKMEDTYNTKFHEIPTRKAKNGHGGAAATSTTTSANKK
ncbi:hypothetical protein AGDE_16987 [Angomonas deanei]|uniref:Uncharacterized protein n=1 Tax=Angomonas deanei TaxID=59799 RepID=A0A7G2C8Q6_9TRYP|nr:hypothetical protein AGDE_16987 [Angomonas deanei]CAD2215153.1 hypothetical protein, conserved [Angomonas deanei]|eukprot:EPY15743.1 hypothetical protein AGDE_16987 [Angomonas deanei]